jgi:prepilin-type N-terminal cleavage/methylation domain-containing protein
MKHKRQAFTLIEIMLVAFIVALLVSVAIVEGARLRKMANESNCQANLKTIANGFEIYSARNGGVYAPAEQINLAFLVDAKCLQQDLVSFGQLGNYRYVVGSISQAGYDIRAMAVSSSLSDHNYQVTTGAILRRSDTAGSGDVNFKNY